VGALPPGLGRRALLGAFAAAALVIPGLAWAGYALHLRQLPLVSAGPGAGLPLPADLDAASAWVRHETPLAARLYVANAAMERGYNNNVLFYVLAQRPCASYWVLVPPVAPPAHDAALRAALADPFTGAVVLWDQDGRGFGQGPLDRALQGFGTPQGRTGAYWIRARKGEPHAP
jgi:hypothetical protein